LPITISNGQLEVNGQGATGAITIQSGDTVAISPTPGTFPAGVFTIYLKTGSINIARVDFVRGLSSIAVTPDSPSIAEGLTNQFIATGTFTDGSTADISSNVTWTTDTPAVASINMTGLATGNASGSSTIIATSGSISGNTLLNVTGAVLQTITITPTSPYTGVGHVEQLFATGTLSDGTSAGDISNNVIWSSDTPDVATINTSTGLVTGFGLGSTAVTATYNGVVGNSMFTVTDNPWSVAASLAIQRAGHTATLLTSGKILVVGGGSQVGGGNPISTELYDPVADSWSGAGNLATIGMNHTATLLPNGKVLVVGGTYRDGIYEKKYASTALYDPTTNTWFDAGSLSTGRAYHTATLLSNGKVLVLGGNAPDTIDAELYDPTTDTWDAVGNLITDRVFHTATLLANGEVLVVGGLVSPYTGVSNAELYDPVTNTSSLTGALADTTYRYYHTATLLPNGKVIVAGGLDGGNAIATTQLYDPTTNNWTLAGDLVAASYNHTSTLMPNGDVLVVGGCCEATGAPTRTEMFNYSTQMWTPAGNLIVGRWFHTANLLTNNKVLVVGGAANGIIVDNELSWSW
jgi:N-acetylneuraminic acid mutarotase